MNAFVLRIIAMVTMVTDHIGWYFLEKPMVLTWIGRIAFPVYALLLAEGFIVIHKDRERLSKHLSIILILVIVSEPGYDLMEAGLDFAHYMDSQSNMVNFLFGYLGMMVTDALCPLSADGTKRVIPVKKVALVCAYALIGFANYMTHGNFNIVGPWLVIGLYWYLRVSRKDGSGEYVWSWGKRLLVLVSGFCFYLAIYFWVRSGFGNAARWWQEIAKYSLWIAGHMIAALLISFYNGKLGYHSKWFSRLYTWFYPVHMYAIGAICLMLGK